ncbi:MAG: ArsR family transcriptional regulator [Thermoplasmata archaeon]
MNRIKVINEPTELVSIFTALNTKIKKEVFEELSKDWCTIQDVEKKFGAEGKNVLQMLEKMKMLEVHWQCNSDKKSEKTYRSNFSSFYISTACGVDDISGVFDVINTPDDVFMKLEKKIIEMVGDGGKFIGDIIEQCDISLLKLKCVVRRSAHLEIKGQHVEKINSENK